MASFRFLYREAEGRIGPRLWAQASALPVGVALAMTWAAWALAPGPRDLGAQPFFSLSIVAVHAYLLVYGFALIFLAVAQYFVSAKRFIDLGKSPSWAGLAPFALLVAGAAAWYQPRSEGSMPAWLTDPFYAAPSAIVIWTIVELGFIAGRPQSAQK